MTENKEVAALIPWSAVEDSQLNVAQLILLGRIVYLAEGKGRCWPDNAALAAVMNRSERNISSHLRVLEDTGYITRSFIRTSTGRKLRIIHTTSKTKP